MMGKKSWIMSRERVWSEYNNLNQGSRTQICKEPYFDKKWVCGSFKKLKCLCWDTLVGKKHLKCYFNCDFRNFDNNANHTSTSKLNQHFTGRFLYKKGSPACLCIKLMFVIFGWKNISKKLLIKCYRRSAR